MKLKSSIAISENGFVFDPEKGISFTTNYLGTKILQLLKEERSKEEILDELQENYDVDVFSLTKDMEDFLNVVSQHQLVEL